ncbi:extracellular solute-binding protein [Ornithinimicrobium cerasi]|uniref:extracellular solute-binding protein n=1 Tax=Ornithinimicrobium cerasi TaxID=2248773 RepID=UPI00301B96E1
MKKTNSILALAAAGTLVLSACGGGESFEDTDGGDGGDASQPAASAEGPASLVMLIGSSGEAETTAVEEATAAWAEETGNEVEVRPATDLGQELAQGFAGGNPPDIFYLDASQVAEQASAGNLFAYEAEDNDDFYPALQEAFTYDGQQWCAPKDFSTLALRG